MPPGWDGVTTIERIWREYPDLPAVIHAPYSDYTAPEIIERLGNNERLLIFKNPPDDEAIHRFAVAITKEWEGKRARQFEQVLVRAANLPWARIFDPDWTRQLAENGNVRCMCDLGHAHLTGYQGVPQDRSQAIRWLREAARLGNQDARSKLVEIGGTALTDKNREHILPDSCLFDRDNWAVVRYNTFPEWVRWILCWPLSFIIAGLFSWWLLLLNGDYIPSVIVGVVHPPLAHAIFLVCIYLTVPRAKLAILLTFIALRSLLLVMFIASAGVTLMGLAEIVTFDISYLQAILAEVAVLVASVLLWREAQRIQGDKK